MKISTCRRFRLLCLGILPLAIALTASNAATFYVAKNGANTNPGTKASPFLTIGFAATKTLPGDVVRVQPGLYEERVSVIRSGTSEGWVNYVAEGQVVCRGFDLFGVNYVRIVGFEITHINTQEVRGITLRGECARIEIVDNYIHHVNGPGIAGAADSSPSYITIRGNTLFYIGCVPGVSSNAVQAIGSPFKTPHHWLVEYNVISRSGDFVNVYGTNIIVRNNYLHDFANVYWNATDSVHSDMFQPGSDGSAVGMRHHVYERNFCGDSVEAHSHFGLWQDTVGAGDTNVMIRGNVGFNFGSTGIGVVSVDHVVAYNNTFHKLQQASRGYALQWYKRSVSIDFPIASLCANTIIHDYGRAIDAIFIEPGTDAKVTHNLGYMAGAHPSYVSTSNPLFIDLERRNFRLQAGSPAANSGTNLAWITSPSGSGTAFSVNDGQLFIDGWGMADGDIVTVGGKTTRITSITDNLATVAESVTWTNKAPIFWGDDTTPDIGALPFGSTELSGASLAQSGTTYTVTPTGDARGVWFYVDGIPAIWVSKPPYSATIATGVVTAKAYALYAQMNPVVNARLRPSTPANVRAIPEAD